MHDIDDAIEQLTKREAERREYRDFFRGNHGVHLTARQRMRLKGNKGFSLNLCKTIVDSLTDRVQVKAINAAVSLDGFDDEAERERAEKEAEAEASAVVRDIWRRSLDAGLNVTALAWRYSVDGDAWLGLEMSDGEATLRQLDNSMVVPLEDGAVFVVTGEDSGELFDRGTITPYYRADDGRWYPRISEDGIEHRSVTGEDGSPLPTLIERIRNGSDDTIWGTSDLDVAVPQQRAINQRVIDIHQVSGQAAWPQRWLIGPNAAGAAPRLLGSEPGAIHGINAPAEGAMELKEFSAADPTKLNETLESLVELLAVTTGTPLTSGGVGANASAESRRIAQDKLTRRVMKCIDAITRAIERLMDAALRARGIDAEVRVDWESPEPVAMKDLLETAAMKRTLGVSIHTLLDELGYDPGKEALYRAEERAEEQQAAIRATTTGTDLPTDLTDLLGPGA